MERWEIRIPGRKKKKTNKTQVVKLTEEAYNGLVEIYNESTLSMKELASTIIIQSLDKVVFIKEEDEGKEESI